MNTKIRFGLLLATVGLLVLAGQAVSRQGVARQYYSNWVYYPQHNYHMSHYYYKPTVTTTTFSYHYCIHYPSEPRYVYYYNPYREVYWGRLDLEAKGDNRYSLLEEKDRKKEKKDIPDSAFPKPGPMPEIPDAPDKVAMEPRTDLPKEAKK